MKKCTICGDTIINGKNGCAMYDTCVKCKPIIYRAAPIKRVNYSFFDFDNSYETRILDRQERYND